MKTSLNETVMAIVRHYGRKKLRARLELIHQNLFTDPAKASFKERILRIFH
jgi:hypothetical protein